MTAKDPLTCGFLKTKIFNLLLRDQHKLGSNNANTIDKSFIYKCHCVEIHDFFDKLDSFRISQDFYSRNLTGVKQILLNAGKKSSEIKGSILETFSDENWMRLSLDEKTLHSPKDCQGCLNDKKFKKGLSLFPINKKGKANYAKAKRHGLVREALNDITNISVKRKEELIKKQVVKDIEDIKSSSAVER